jgi:hypothetical protein
MMAILNYYYWLKCNCDLFVDYTGLVYLHMSSDNDNFELFLVISRYFSYISDQILYQNLCPKL